jgi:hypothetical protein
MFCRARVCQCQPNTIWCEFVRLLAGKLQLLLQIAAPASCPAAPRL